MVVLSRRDLNKGQRTTSRNSRGDEHVTDTTPQLPAVANGEQGKIDDDAGGGRAGPNWKHYQAKGSC